jgi:hypothetical protein
VMKYLGGAKTDSAGLQIGRLSGTIDLSSAATRTNRWACRRCSRRRAT